MPDDVGPLYEVTHRVDRDILEDFDVWLGGHVEEMLELPGIIRASTYVADDDSDGQPRRVTQYFFETDNDLDAYLNGPAADMRQGAEHLFAGRFEVSRRILHETEVIDGAVVEAELCLNCGTPLGGQYCGNCGQRARSRLISIWDLTREAFGDLFELDSRLWRTLIPLIARPGELTRDYLEGRRARSMPPFRTYLVLSILFFVIAFFDPRQSFSIFFEPDPAAETTESDTLTDAIRNEAMEELAEEGMLPDGDVPTGDDEGDITLRLDGEDVSAEGQCEDVDIGDAPEWMTSRLTPERLTAVCERVIADGGRTFLRGLLDNVPAALFILLPLLAFILKVLYPLSKRYYVEHLLFVVHFHAFAFLILTLQVLFSRLAGLISAPDALAAITAIAVFFYVPVYFYKSMRRVYEQGHVLTMLKFTVLSAAYATGLSLIFVGAAIFTAFSM